MTNDYVELNDGAGGKKFESFFNDLILPLFDNKYLRKKGDGALLPPLNGRVVMSTDSHVVSPLFFPGGDIGSLAFCGTVNDVAMMGARPLYLSMGLIIEEGFSLLDLKKIFKTISLLSKKHNIPIVTGDTKVVEKGKADGIFIQTTGIGVIENPQIDLSPENIKAGDKVIMSGSIGDHATTILSQRENLEFKTNIKSDCAPLHELVAKILQEFPRIHCLRDPTRGGVSSALNELADSCGLKIQLEENRFIISPAVKSCSLLLGVDSLTMANEGKFLLFCPEKYAGSILQLMKEHPYGKDAFIIGSVLSHKSPEVSLITSIGGERLVPWPIGEDLPRIC